MKNVLIAMATHCTPENGRIDLLDEVIENLNIPAWAEFVLIDNSPKGYLDKFLERDEFIINENWKVIRNGRNEGTAFAINQGWREAESGYYLCKMDDDCVVDAGWWVGEMVEAMERDPSIGILGLKRKDLMENPNLPETDWMHSKLRMLPHEPGERWIVVEEVNHVMGTCQMYSPKLIEKIGGLYQMDGLYGFDDSLAAVRCKIAGFKNCFLPHVEIDHIDPGGTPYQHWKEKYAGERMAQFNRVKYEYEIGERSIYVPL